MIPGLSDGFDGYAIGGLSVGEPKEAMYEMTELVTENLPADKPRYLMGVGKPEDLLESIARGIDMSDCIMPTRNGRNGQAFTVDGPINIKNEMNKELFEPLDKSCGCYTCTHFSRAYLHYLFKEGLIAYFHLASIHNVHVMQTVCARMRELILKK